MSDPDPDPTGPIYTVPPRNINAKATTPTQFATWRLVTEGPKVRWSVLAIRLVLFLSAVIALAFNAFDSASYRPNVMVWITVGLCLAINGYELLCYLLAVWKPHRKWAITPMRLPATLFFDMTLCALGWVALSLKWNEFSKYDRVGTPDDYYSNEHVSTDYWEPIDGGNIWVLSDKARVEFYKTQALARLHGPKILVGLLILAIGHALLVVAECVACGVYCRREKKGNKTKAEIIELETEYGPREEHA
ncbi:hypothetical protein BJ508DRAFT_376855 [Ascobolus immersus RN42]|uniref:Uncharacterized protein n=1 Tax=Ascobolus immersus RN42 TaxID=1160509 RepID=A0A3N4I4E3_ASCIM|nr:hypothetical protein BJ508DRAFT_376855 [Ascobolus immersus RN42]